jgi:hypothetical protein
MEVKTEGAMGPLPEKARVLHRLIGDWKMHGKGHMDGDEFDMDGSWCESPTASGFGLSGRWQVVDPEGKYPTYHESDLWGYDSETDTFHYLYVDNAGQVRDFTGRLVEPDKLELSREDLQDGKKRLADYEIVLVGDNEIRMRGTVMVEDRTVSDFDVVLSRQQ